MKRKKMKMAGPVFECVLCCHTGSKGHMLEHFIRSHVTTDRAPWSCSLCGFRAISRHALFNHDRLYMHKSAEKKNPGAPTTFVKSSNPYIVSVGQDIRRCNGPADWESNEGSNNEEISPGKKRRVDEPNINRKKIRAERYTENRWHEQGSDRKRPSRFHDYDTDDIPDMPVYDLQDNMEFERHNYHSERRNYDQSPFPGVGRGEAGRGTLPRREGDVENSRRIVRADWDNLYQYDSDFSDGTHGQMGEGRMPDSLNGMAWGRRPMEQVDDHSDFFTSDNGTMETLPERTTSSYAELEHDSYNLRTPLFRRFMQAGLPQFGGLDVYPASGQQADFSECRSESFDLNVQSGLSVKSQPESSANTDFSAAGVNRELIPSSKLQNLNKLNLERVPASSSTVGDRTIVLESSDHGNSPTTTPKETEPDRPSTSKACPVGKIRRSSKNADQSAEVGSSCSTGKERDRPDVTSDAEHRANGVSQQVTPRRPSGNVSSNATVQQDSEHPEQGIHMKGSHHDEEDCPEDESQTDDELTESQLLEDKMTELINALEPLKNISKALIAMDHHMRRLLPMVENLTKDMASPKTQK